MILPSETKCSWPTKSERVVGRIRSASGVEATFASNNEGIKLYYPKETRNANWGKAKSKIGDIKCRSYSCRAKIICFRTLIKLYLFSGVARTQLEEAIRLRRVGPYKKKNTAFLARYLC